MRTSPAPATTSRTEYVINSPPDGYTVYLVNPANGINASLYKKLNFNFVRDMAPVGGIMRVPNVMIVHPDMPVKTVAEFIDLCKSQPEQGEPRFRPATVHRCISRASCS